jgi:starch-binding outer membrane protein, SusD/RagB family
MKQLYHIAFLLITIVVGSCSKSFLEKEYKNQPNPDDYWKDAKSAEQTITTCYAPIKYNGLYGLTLPFVLHSLDPDVVNEGGDYSRYQKFSFFTDDGRIANIYHALYTGINRCNLALEKIPPIKMDESLKNRFLGEALFLRALYYYHLTTLFYQPPIITKSINNFINSSNFTNASQDSLFGLIISDLNAAIGYLPSNDQYGDGNKGRATKGASYALLGKVYIWQHNWQRASEIFLKIINQETGTYELIQPKLPADSLDYVYAYLCNFSLYDLKNKNNTYPSENNYESIFEVQNASYQSDQWNPLLDGYGTDGSLITDYFSIYGNNGIGAISSFKNKFDYPDSSVHLSHDPRLYASVFQIGDSIRCWPSPPDKKKLCNTVIDSSRLMPASNPIKKYMFPIYCGTLESGNMDPNNWRLIRYADVLLLYAEAQYHLGNLSEAFDKLNQVRRRAGLKDASGDFRNALIKEREIEFCFEASFYLDLIRWHMIMENGSRFINIRDYVPGFIVGKNEYFPIPRIEIDYMKGSLKQNPGW